MKIVLDTNIVFSAALSKNSIVAQTFFKLKTADNALYCPHELFSEIDNHFAKLCTLSGLPAPIMRKRLDSLLADVEAVETNSLPKKALREAYELCKNIDPADSPFVALCLFVEGSFLWSGDKKLKMALEKKGFRRIINTADFNFF